MQTNLTVNAVFLYLLLIYLLIVLFYPIKMLVKHPHLKNTYWIYSKECIIKAFVYGAAIICMVFLKFISVSRQLYYRLKQINVGMIVMYIIATYLLSLAKVAVTSFCHSFLNLAYTIWYSVKIRRVQDDGKKQNIIVREND